MGVPRDLNLPWLADSSCQPSCSFKRRVTDQVGGASWIASGMDFPAGVSVDVSPANFSLANGQTQELHIVIDHSQSGILGEWISGVVKMSTNGLPDKFLKVNVFSDYGE